MKKTIISAIALFFFCSVLSAQHMSLDGVVRNAQDSAITAYRSKNALEQSRWGYNSFLSGRRPQLNFLLTPGYQKIENEPFTHYWKLRNYNMLNTYAEVRLEQQLNGIGGNFYASTGAMWTEYFGADAASRIFSTVPLGVGYSNDLLGYNPFKWEKMIEDYRMESALKEHSYELERIASEAESYYIDYYVAYTQCQLCESNSKVTQNLVEIGQEKFGIASITKNELLALELQHLNAENSLFDARRELENARGRLLSYLKIQDFGQELVLEKPENPEYLAIDYEQALRSAKTNNPSYRKNSENILVARSKLDKAKAKARVIQTGIDLSVGVQSNAGKFGSAYLGQTPFVIGGITFRIPIFDSGLAKNRVKSSEYGLKVAQSDFDESERTIELQVSTALRDFNSQQDLLQRTTRALDIADDSFRLAEELYGNGQTDINTFFLAQNRKDEAHMNYLKALKGYWDSYYALRVICGGVCW